jgi:hypothetical protein
MHIYYRVSFIYILGCEIRFFFNAINMGALHIFIIMRLDHGSFYLYGIS